MTKTKHTPGPWRALTEDGKWRIRSSLVPYIAMVYEADEARLIAASPEMMAELWRSNEAMKNALSAMRICGIDDVNALSMEMQIARNESLFTTMKGN